MMKRALILFISLTLFISSKVYAQAEDIDNPGHITIYLPTLIGDHYRGSSEQRIDDMEKNPAIKVTFYDAQKNIDFSSAELGARDFCKDIRKRIADGMIKKNNNSDMQATYLLYGKYAFNMETEQCFVVPVFIQKLQAL